MTNKEKIKTVMESHNLLHLATVDSDGIPKVRGVDYAMGDAENELYFMTYKATNKVAEIKHNPNVSVVIDHDCPSMKELAVLTYIKATGKATILNTQEEIQKAMGMIMMKFPHLKDLPGDPKDFYPIKVVLDKIYVTDNNVRFGNTELVEY